MFSLSTEYGNTLDLSDCVLNSLEIESPFISFYNRALEYTVSYYLDDKSLCAEYTGDDVDLENLFSLYWEGLDIAGQRIALALDSQDRIADFHDMPEEYITTAATVILHVMDRFSRDRYDSATYKHILKKNGVKVISATENISDSPEGILLESLLEGLSEYYSAELSVKIQRGQMENAMKGKNNGGTVPLGLRKGPDGVMELDPITAPIVQEIFRRYDKGESMTDIVASLNERGIRTAKDLPFRIGCLGTVLKNRKYIGEYRYGKIVIPDKLPVIIDVELFDRVQRRMEVNRHAPARAKADEEYLLTTKLFCGHCERMLAGESGRSRNGEVHYYYKCGGAKRKQGCTLKTVKKRWIERTVVTATIARVLHDDVINRIADALVAYQDKCRSFFRVFVGFLQDIRCKNCTFVKLVKVLTPILTPT